MTHSGEIQTKLVITNLKWLYLYLVSYAHAGSPYNPDVPFSVSSLSRLEATGIQIVASLNDLRRELEDILGVDKFGSAGEVISEWVSGRSRHPPTWRALHDILRELDLVELSQQIEDYLSGE